MFFMNIIRSKFCLREYFVVLTFPKFKTLGKLTGQIRNRNEHGREIFKSKTEFINKRNTGTVLKKLK